VLSVNGGRAGPVASVLRLLFALLALLYCGGLEVYLLPYRLGLRRRTRLECPVICVGNLSTGGTGKTPMTLMICRAMRERGRKVAVLSRGYRGRHEYDCAVVSDTEQTLISADEAGDEAYLLAASLPGVPVIVGKDRRKTGALAVERFNPDLLIMDDGFQFWQLHRDLDIVLLDAARPFDNGWTLPRGLLREPPSHLRRAAVAVLSGVERVAEEQVEASRSLVAKTAPASRIFESRVHAKGLRSIHDDAVIPLEWLSGRAVAAVCGLGNPAAFEQTLRGLGGRLVFSHHLQDHAPIDMATWNACVAQAAACGADAIVITEKDAVKAAAPPAGIIILILSIVSEVRGTVDLLSLIDAAAGMTR
jgi:tetraacyldisaccharide 4'-kinase